MNRTLQDVVETVGQASARGRKCALLIGAGCSVKAGIPTAVEFIEIIRTKYPQAYNRAATKTYPECMAELAVAERRDLIAHYVDHAKINWAHVGIAQLIKEGYVDRVLTTNFDMLIQRSCALAGIFPAVYDFAASQLFRPADVADPAIFHLHGQRNGFVLLHTAHEVRKHYALLENAFTDAHRGRVWLVVGYSGENDPVFQHIAHIPSFDNNLYWIGYRDNPPPAHVRERLLLKDKYAFFVPGFDADDFFVRLTQELKCFPPHFVSKPFTHLEKLMAMLVAYTIPGDSSAIDVTAQTREWIRKAVQEHEERTVFAQRPTFNPLAANRALMAGEYAEVVSMYESSPESVPPEAFDVVCWAYITQGNALAAKAKMMGGPLQDSAFDSAFGRFERAAAISPTRPEVLNAWGAALLAQAENKRGGEARELILQAIKKHEAALNINPDDAWSLNNLGNALVAMAMKISGDEAHGLINRAISHYRRALEKDPCKHEVVNSWGEALERQALRTEGEGAVQLLDESAAQYLDALRIKPDDYWAMNRLASVLLEKSFRRASPESDALAREALEWYERATHVNAERHWTLHNWGNALATQAKRRTDEERDRLFALAERTFQAALEIKPDYYWVLNSWGYALYERGLMLEGAVAREQFRRAGEKFFQSLQLNQNDSWALHNWGNVLIHEATFEENANADRLLALADSKFEAAAKINPRDCWTFIHWAHSFLVQAERKSQDEARELLHAAREKLNTAESFESGCSTFALARTCARLGLNDECRIWLEKCRKLSLLPTTDVLVRDSAFAKVRSMPWFELIVGAATIIEE